MPNRHLLYLSAHQLSAYVWKAGHLHDDGSFPETEAGLAAFRQYLGSRNKHLFYLLTNVADEGFQQETIPFLHGRDRETVIRRKLAQYFYTTPLTLAIGRGYEKNRRKDEHLLLAALTNPNQILPWTMALQAAGAPLVGIYSLALLGAPLLQKLRINEARCLLLTLQDQSIRQSFFEKGELHFSRLTPLHDSSIGGIAQAISSEAAKLHQYLASQRLLTRNQPLKVYALVHGQARQAVAAACLNTALLDFQIVANDEAAKQAGLRTGPATSRSEALFLHLLATATPRQQFADPALRHDYRVWQLKTFLSSGGLFLFLACLLFGARQFHDAHRLTQESAAIQAEAQGAMQRYNDMAKTFPALPVDNDTLRQIINRYQNLEQLPDGPKALYQRISQALEAAPQVELESLVWQQGGIAGTSPAPISAMASGTGLTDSILLKGAIPTGPNTTPRQLLAIFDRFLKALQAFPELQIQVQQQPFDVESGKAMKGGDDNPMVAEPRRFTVQITRKVSG